MVAEVLPDGKVELVEKYKQDGKIVAMAGDGINDAPALAAADVGFAMGTGTDIAMESGDVVLVGGGLTALVTAVKISRATMRKIRQNLFWAFFYNCIGIPVAAFGLLSPVIAGRRDGVQLGVGGDQFDPAQAHKAVNAAEISAFFAAGLKRWGGSGRIR